MSMRTIAPRVALIAALAAIVAIAPPGAPPAAATTTKPTKPTKAPKPRVVTGPATHVFVSSALLTASINPNGDQTSYYFQYGSSTAYGSQTPTVVVGNGTSKVSVGQSISGLHTGVTYHYRVVALISSGESAGELILGRDRGFTVGRTASRLELPKRADVVVGTPFLVSGRLTGAGNADQAVVLQDTSYPYSEGFTTLGTPGVTDSTGRFSFTVPPIFASTDLRVVTPGLLPVYSPIETVRAHARVVLHVRTSAQPGLVRVYGTVQPAEVGAKVILQAYTTVAAGQRRPGAEAKPRFVKEFTTVVKKGNRAFSRFSVVVDVRRSGSYRAVVKLGPGGPILTGTSSTIMLHAGPRRTRTGQKSKGSG